QALPHPGGHLRRYGAADYSGGGGPAGFFPGVSGGSARRRRGNSPSSIPALNRWCTRENPVVLYREKRRSLRGLSAFLLLPSGLAPSRFCQGKITLAHFVFEEYVQIKRGDWA